MRFPTQECFPSYLPKNGTTNLLIGLTGACACGGPTTTLRTTPRRLGSWARCGYPRTGLLWDRRLLSAGPVGLRWTWGRWARPPYRGGYWVPGRTILLSWYPSYGQEGYCGVIRPGRSSRMKLLFVAVCLKHPECLLVLHAGLIAGIYLRHSITTPFRRVETDRLPVGAFVRNGDGIRPCSSAPVDCKHPVRW